LVVYGPRWKLVAGPQPSPELWERERPHTFKRRWWLYAAAGSTLVAELRERKRERERERERTATAMDAEIRTQRERECGGREKHFSISHLMRNKYCKFTFNAKWNEVNFRRFDQTVWKCKDIFTDCLIKAVHKISDGFN
jgi:hypothetical protein